MNTLEAALERVQKYLKLAQSDNEHEATIAARRAKEIMAEYNLDEAMLRLDDDSRKAEEIVDNVQLPRDPEKRHKRTAWKETIAKAVANSLGCHMYWKGGVPTCFGRIGATQTWSYTCQYLYREVDRIADEAWTKHKRKTEESTKIWKNAFRAGAAQAISNRLYVEREVEREEREEKREAVERAVAKVSKADQAIALLFDDEKEVKDAYAVKSEKFGTIRSIGGRNSSTDGYLEGRKAGKAIPINAKRAGLGSGGKP